MSKRRTKLDKIKAKHRKHSFGSTKSSPSVRNLQIEIKQEITQSRGTFYTPTLELPMNLLRKDLTKTLVVTILAIIVQVCLAYYLNQGGWEIINKAFISKIVGFG